MQRSVLGLATALLGFGPGSARTPRAIARARGTEDATLVDSASGSVVFVDDERALRVLDLPTLCGTVVAPRPGGERVVVRAAGPDGDGRVYFVVEDGARGRTLESLRLDPPSARRTWRGADGDAWDGQLGSSLALSDAGNRLASVVPTEGVQFDGVYLREGELEVWDATRATTLDVRIRALDCDLSWTADGERLCFVRRVSRDALPGSAFPSGGVPFGRRLLDSPNGVPAVCLTNVETRRSTIVSVGTSALVTPDGASVLVGDGEGHWRLVDVRGGGAMPVPLPGVVRPLAFVGPDLLLHAGLPTEGAPVGMTKSASPLVGRRELPALKLLRPSTGAFQTVLPSIDLRTPISFGRRTRIAHG